MTDSGCCPSETGNANGELPAQMVQPPARITNSLAAACPVCGARGKPVPGQTVRALASVSLRSVREVEYLFCKTQFCPVVYYSADGVQTFTVDQVRERVYQKEPENPDVYFCYCFRHKVGEMLAASPEGRAAILADISSGTNSGQCACDLRNPQGSCCLVNARRLARGAG